MRSSGVRNPWATLPAAPPYVLAEDRPYVESFNANLTPDSPYRIRTDLLPDPFTGPVDAPVVILNRNPGVGGRRSRATPPAGFCRGSSRRARRHAIGPAASLLARGVRPDRWRQLVARRAPETLGPRAHLRGARGGSFSPSNFTGTTARSGPCSRSRCRRSTTALRLVEDAVERGATVVIMRGHRDWKVAVPSLRTYPRAVEARNRQQKAVSPGQPPRRRLRSRAPCPRGLLEGPPRAGRPASWCGLWCETVAHGVAWCGP